MPSRPRLPGWLSARTDRNGRRVPCVGSLFGYVRPRPDGDPPTRAGGGPPRRGGRERFLYRRDIAATDEQLAYQGRIGPLKVFLGFEVIGQQHGDRHVVIALRQGAAFLTGGERSEFERSTIETDATVMGQF